MPTRFMAVAGRLAASQRSAVVLTQWRHLCSSNAACSLPSTSASETQIEIDDPPPPTPHFMGRQRAMERLREILQAPSSSLASVTPGRTAILTGLDGVGKSTLAAAYAHRYAADYAAVLWVRMHRRPLASEWDWARPTLPPTKRALVVIDSAIDYPPDQAEALRALGDVIVTTTQANLESVEGRQGRLKLAMFNGRLGVEYLQRRLDSSSPTTTLTTSTSDAAATTTTTTSSSSSSSSSPVTEVTVASLSRLVDILGGLPLALELAADHLVDNCETMTVDKLHDALFRNRLGTLWKIAGKKGSDKRTKLMHAVRAFKSDLTQVFRLYQSSMRSTALHNLAVLSFMENDPLVPSVAKSIMGDVDPSLALFVPMVRELQMRSLAHVSGMREPTTSEYPIYVHPLVQDILRENIFCLLSFETNSLLTVCEHDLLGSVKRALALPSGDARTYFLRSLGVYASHVLARSRRLTELKGHTIRTTLATMLVEVWVEVGEPALALRAAQTGVRLARPIRADLGYSYAVCLRALSIAHAASGDTVKAHTVLNDALNFLRELKTDTEAENEVGLPEFALTLIQKASLFLSAQHHVDPHEAIHLFANAILAIKNAHVSPAQIKQIKQIAAKGIDSAKRMITQSKSKQSNSN